MITLLSITMLVSVAAEEAAPVPSASTPAACQVAAYYFPNYHPCPQNEARYGKGWSEWDLIRQATPRFPDHGQPKVPAWGYEDESDPAVMAKKIDAAADHGVTAFIFDWYWHESGPFLERGLENGFLKAPNTNRLKFALMWANHDWINIFPAKAKVKPELLYPGKVSLDTFRKATDHIIQEYFSKPNYWCIEGKPYFSLYELMTLMDGLGGLEATRVALDDFRARAKAAGLPGIHLNAVMWGIQVLPSERTPAKPKDLIEKLGFDSVTSYCWVHHVYPDSFPTASYADWRDTSTVLWPEFAKKWPVPYYPNVSMGWDPSPRTTQSDAYEHHGYPFTTVVVDNTPAEFEESLRRAKAFLETQPANQRILTINAWNEWTEGSYLEPDTVNGLGYLEAIKRVFAP